MVQVPDATPVRIPVVAPILAIPGALLLHVPPGTASVSVEVAPTHKDVIPVIAGVGLTVTVNTDVQPETV